MDAGELLEFLALPNRPPVEAIMVDRSEKPGFVVEHLRFDLGEPVRGLLMRPSRAEGRLPAVLYCHAHGAKYEIGASELI